MDIMREELVPAMGCTEPIAVAYAGALARQMLGDTPENYVALSHHHGGVRSVGQALTLVPRLDYFACSFAAF